MDEHLLRLMENRADIYPVHLERQFPRILSKIVDNWGQPHFDHLISTLMLDERGNRSGFPEDVAVELFHLAALHKAQMQRLAPVRGDVWEEIAGDSRRGTQDKR